MASLFYFLSKNCVKAVSSASQALISAGPTRDLIKIQILIHSDVGTIIPVLQMGKPGSGVGESLAQGHIN